jgi:hypothetical protein
MTGVRGISPPTKKVLYCPSCKAQHIDAPDPANGWLNPPHRTHLCHACGHLWRPYDYPTEGVYRPDLEYWYRVDGLNDGQLMETKYPVEKHTACGVWLDLDLGWVPPEKKRRLRFVLHDSRKKFAYPDRMEALRGFTARKRRQLVILEAQMKSASKALGRAQRLLDAGVSVGAELGTGQWIPWLETPFE